MDLKSMERNSRNRLETVSLLTLRPWRTQGGKGEERERVNGSEAGGELGKVPGTTWRRSTAGKSGSLSTTARTTASGGLRRHYCALCRTGRSMGEERERD